MTHQFVEYIPASLADDTIYVSIKFATASHKCCCGCGNEVVTPLSPTDWELTFDGVSVSLDPSIGNWSFKCRSHYWIRRNKAVWSTRWSDERIAAARAADQEAKANYYQNVDCDQTSTAEEWPNSVLTENRNERKNGGLLGRFSKRKQKSPRRPE